MTRPNPRHPRCGGQWRGPLADDTGTWLVCNTCGEQVPAAPGDEEPHMPSTPDMPAVHGPGSAELFAVSPSSGTATDHGRVAILRAEAQQRAARLEAALRSLPPGGTLHA